MLALLLGNQITYVAHVPVSILSIHADRHSPFNPVTLRVANIVSILPGTSTITYGNLEVPLASIDYGNNTITSLLPHWKRGQIYFAGEKIMWLCLKLSNKMSFISSPLGFLLSFVNSHYIEYVSSGK